MSIEIKYCGNTIATLSASQSCSLKCYNTIMKDDVVIINNEKNVYVDVQTGGYATLIAKVQPYHTAILKCAGKKSDSMINISPHLKEPEEPTPVEIKIGDSKTEPTIWNGSSLALGFAEGTKVVIMSLESTKDVDDKRLALEVDSSKQYIAIDFALEFALWGNLYVWTVADDGERVLAATILEDGGVAAGALVDVIIKDSKGNDVTNQVLIARDSSVEENYTLYVYYNGADEVHIGCDDYDEELGGNILYFANAING